VQSALRCWPKLTRAQPARNRETNQLASARPGAQPGNIGLVIGPQMPLVFESGTIYLSERN
jgi:hypothetical protein